MIRVLNVISDTNIGGAGRVILNYLRSADRATFETHVALPQGSLLIPPLDELGAIVHPVDGLAERSYHRQDVSTLRQLMREVCPDLVHTHGALSGRIAAKREGIPVIFTRHSAFPVSAKLRYPPGRWVNRWLNHHYSNHIIAVSPASAQNLTDAGVSPKRITTMMNGVAAVPRSQPDQVAALKAQYAIPEEAFVVGILARLEDYKGHSDILSALHILRQQGRNIHLLVAGLGPYEDTIRQETAQLGLEDCVHMMGFCQDVAPFLSALDLQLNASYGTETSSLSIIEGMSMSLPAVVSDYGGNPYLIDHEITGLLFPTRNGAALAQSIASLMDNPDKLTQLGENALAAFSQKYTGQVFASNIEAVYRDVLKGAN